MFKIQQEGSVGTGSCQKPDNLTSIPGTHMVGENELWQVIFWLLHVFYGMLTGACVLENTHKHTE